MYKILGHTSYLGQTGYANHARNFFNHLNKLVSTRIRNYSHISDISNYTQQELDMLIEQRWSEPPYQVGRPYIKDENALEVNIVLNESNHYYFYDNYKRPFIFYNVWESTRQMQTFFNRMLEADQLWVPTNWQRQCTIKQGYPADKIRVIPEGVDGTIFKPANNSETIRKYLYTKYNIPDDALCFMIFGRWDYRKSIEEMIRCFNEEFKDDDNIYLIISVDNPFSVDGMNSTEERLKYHGLENDRIRVLHFPPREEYIQWLQSGNIYLSCSRSEGWNLPLIEALACGAPSICSHWGGQEYAYPFANLVNVPKELPPKNVFNMLDKEDLGFWGEPNFDHLKYIMRQTINEHPQQIVKFSKVSEIIRNTYTWESAALQAKENIDKLVKKYQPNKNLIKLNLGCGNDIKPGYINIDKYNNTKAVDYQWDIGKLELDDNNVDEIYTSHVFEHIELNQVYSVLKEWERVLKINGRLIIHVPNLETEVKIWLEASNERKWFELHHIFGSQSHPGNAHLNGHTKESLKWLIERFNFQVTDLTLGNTGFGEEIRLTAKRIPDKYILNPIYSINFIDGPKVEILGDSKDTGFYVATFHDLPNNSMVHQWVMSINTWTMPYRKWYTDWFIQIERNGELVCEHMFECKGKNVLISFDSKSLGDSIAWMAKVEEFRKKHNCNVYLSTFWNKLFIDAYPKINFIEPGSVVNNLYASYIIGCWEGSGSLNKNKEDWRTVSLQNVCSNILGVNHKEIITNLGIEPEPRPIKEKYVTISEFSTFQCKFWNYPGGWQEIVNYLNTIGYRVMVISKEETQLKNIIDQTGKSIEETITNIYHSEFFIGVSAGPAWIAWALRKPVILISGFSLPIAEFQNNCERVINTDICHGCFNRIDNNFDRGQWEWCPFQQGTERQFECTKKIVPRMIINRIDKIKRR